jgi:hypothetical protein
MRIMTAAVAATLAVLSQPIGAQTQICDLSGECHNFVNPGDADRYMRSVDVARAKRSRDIEQAMPIDYRDCIVVALSDEMTSDKAQHYFIDDLDKHLQSKLGQRGIRALPGAVFPKKWRLVQNHSGNTPYWHFSFAFTGVAKPGEEYEASVGFQCGSRCTSRTAYVLKVVGSACEIVSKRWEGGA